MTKVTTSTNSKKTKVQKKRVTSADTESKEIEPQNAKATTKSKKTSNKKVGWWNRKEEE